MLWTSGSPDLWVLVVTFRSAEVIGDLLEAMPAALEGCGPVGLLIVDNDSDDDTLEIVDQDAPGARVVRTGANLGYSGAINRGLEAIGPVDVPVLVLNPDVRLAPRSVRSMLDALGAGIGVVVPRLLESDGRTAHSLRRDPSVLRAWGEAILGGRRAGRWGVGELVVRAADYERAHDVDWATGAAWLMAPDCLRSVGRWDESFFLYSEETDYALRARAAGYRLRYEPAAEGTHAGGDRLTSAPLYALMALNRVRLVRKTHPARARAFRWALLMGELVRCARRSSVHIAAVRALATGRAPIPGAAASAPGAGPRQVM